MTFPAAPLGTTVRVLRTAAGRRALQLVLLVGGLFVLGFLCGEQAHAADGTTVPAKATSVRSAVTGHEDPARPVQAVGTATERVAADLHTADLHAADLHTVGARTLGEQAVTPVRDVLTTVTRTVTATVTRTVTATAAQAVGEEPRAAPPSLPLPGLTPVKDAPVPPMPEPASTAPGSQRHGGAAATSAAVAQKQRHARAHPRAATVHAPAPTAAYGPVAIPAPQSVARAFATHGGAAVGAPGRPAPTPDPDGVLGKQAADAGASRHGDAHAVTLDGRAPLRLTLGAAARVDAPRTRERHRDIPVFPG
ncbi:hypothetical protein [Streptomyces sp. NPDC048191]|uniref:hypothetical protein n=1 Tax=Streptomyces sp. NPDC048191 TaxID=3155484 RepID=UPI0033E0A714